MTANTTKATRTSPWATTNGGSLPHEIAEITRYASGGLGARIGIHTHDDIGVGVANALAAIDAGASHVQGTLNGYGERTGNCSLTSIMPILEFKCRRPSVPVESLPPAGANNVAPVAASKAQGPVWHCAYTTPLATDTPEASEPSAPVPR